MIVHLSKRFNILRFNDFIYHFKSRKKARKIYKEILHDIEYHMEFEFE